MESSFENTLITLYQPDQDLRARGVAAEALSRYINTIETAARLALNNDWSRQGVSGALVLGVKPAAKSHLWIVLDDERRKREFMILLKADIEAIAPPSVKGPIAFALQFDAWGGGRRPGMIAAPSEWADASRRAGRALAVPDEIFDSLWPD